MKYVLVSSVFWDLAQFRIFMISVDILTAFFAECGFADGSDFVQIK